MAELVGLIIIAVLYFLKMIFETVAAAQKDKNAEQEAEENLLEERTATATKRSKHKRKRRQKQPKKEYVLELENEPVHRRGTLSRELNPLGEGTRIEAAPGTLSTTRQLAHTTLVSTVKPELESLTGIYDTVPDSSAQKIQTFDLNKMLTQPDSVRQGILWEVILKRPEW